VIEKTNRRGNVKLTHILPFMETEELKDLAKKIINEEVKGVKLVTVFPFLSNEDLDEVVDLLIEKGKGKKLSYVLPFASKKTIKKIMDGVKDGSITGLKEHYLYPFLGNEELKSMFDKLVKEAQENAEDDDDDDDEADEVEEVEDDFDE
jgi:hypothetical protein